MRQKIVAGNWKMNNTLQEGIELVKNIKNALNNKKVGCEVIIGAPFIHLAHISDIVKGSDIKISAENCADKASGAYTGEVSASMIASTGAEYCIIGHSERRAYYGETYDILREKVLLALNSNLKPIFCIGETKDERESNIQNQVVKKQLDGSVFNLDADDFKNIILAYEPVWAIGTGLTASSQQAQEMHAFIRSLVADKYGSDIADSTTILYGGSCKPSNAKELFSMKDVDGGLIGGASLKTDDFVAIIDAI